MNCHLNSALSDSQALAGLLVVEHGERTGVSVCCSTLAQLGATVVAIEREDAGPVPGNMSVKWNWRDEMLAGKLSLVARGNDANLVRRLLELADIVVTATDMTSSAIVTWDVPHTQVVCNITAMGESGPHVGQPFCEEQLQALTGMMETTGLPDGGPLIVPLPIVEYLGGLHAAGAALAARRFAEHGGRGQRIDIALYDCAFNAMASFFSRLLVDGCADAKTQRIGNRHTLSAPWNAYQARNGWVLICTGSDIQWRRLCELIGRRDLARDTRYVRSRDRVARVQEVDAVISEWVSRQSQTECIAALAQANIPGGPVVNIDSYPREPNLDHRHMICRLVASSARELRYAPGSPLRMDRTPGVALSRVPAPDEDRSQIVELSRGKRASPAPVAPINQPLEGLRVLEMGHYTTAPEAARHLAALGAEVIKIEPPQGEATRAWAPFVHGQSVFYTIKNSDKSDLTLDLNTEKDRAILRLLIERSDVLVENLKPGALAKHGFSTSHIAALNPCIVYCAISGFGAESLYGGRPAFDTVVQAMSALMDQVRCEGTPLKTGVSIADVLTASMSVVAILAALAYRHRSGLGQFIDLSMQDVLAWTTQTAWNSAKTNSAAKAVACGDGYVMVTDAVAGVSIPSLSRDEAVARCVSKGVRCAPVLTLNEVLGSTQATARQLHFKLQDKQGQWPALAVPLRLQLTPPIVARPGPSLGRDSAEILNSLATQHH